ncbi:LamB/YcsF family protein [Arthrobacter psychrolactophilus]|uniref:5-oxoprolinase subunit A n=1 Tax=Arthrobacter psychrolactophilus TaxID=92442 RepID=A0A2V5ILF6_9MICC|nr:5-oxoprolinase subunit PxpA [Arthrobacter psychrolactophilus]PYI37488.1 LamB/YcsF family protein [Arthrobacter psychrolactophilus]
MHIDLNADVGESLGQWTLGDDAAIMDQVSSASIACGFHAGDPSTMRQSCATAAAKGVSIGAHPSYRDLTGFGRRFMDIASSELSDELIYQIGALQAIARAEGTTVNYVKPHGALYNAIVHHTAQAEAVVAALSVVELPLLVAPNSEVQRLALAAGLTVVTEAFADRAYNPDGTLVARTQPGAVLHSLEAVVAQSLDIALHQEVTAIDGSRIGVEVQSLCLHGDTPGAVAMAAAVRTALHDSGVTITSFVP